MTAWTTDELNKIGSADEIQVAPLRQDGTPYKQVTIWVVRVGDAVYIRSYNGRDGAWYRHALESHKSNFWAGGVEKTVSLAEVSDAAVNDQVDAAYQQKYGHLPQYVAPMVTDEVRSTTFKLVPLDL